MPIDATIAGIGGFFIGCFVMLAVIIIARMVAAARPAYFVDDEPFGDMPRVPWDRT